MDRAKGVERWVLERWDQDEELTRVEICRATDSGAKSVAALFNPASNQGPPDKEDLSWWDTDSVETWETSLKGLLSTLGLDASVELAEGVAFYVFWSKGKTPDKVVDATPLVRKLAKVMYNDLLDIQTESNKRR